ncbi:TetR/AcrR family transcriptional regulator [Paraliomyxa miuraensis]|uniref:TetR/AcrR family transcriptional regulator n=1 Tax=Paraliomyxa miuraensis TaxID=376150 RepID=UPI002250E975|nr:TetR/AcrR family transcriptional regulator [Paraliomyxa miuraensis]MCX4246158.1 TetR/AcrR family transcriptional regulator [Paraliomyxa miuraensis]
MSQAGEIEGDAVDARILEAAQRLLERHGPTFTMAQLAEASGVSRATLYRRVPSREALAGRLRAQGVEPGAELGDPTHERILDAIGGLIDAHGLRFTLEQVADSAGVGVATVYRSFGDREGLLRVFFAERSPRRMAAEQLRDLEAPVEVALTAFVGAVLRFAVQHPGLARIGLLGEGPDAVELERLRKGGRSTLSRLVGYLEAQIERGALVPADPWLLAATLLGGAITTSLLAPRMLAGGSRRLAARLRLPSDDEVALDERAATLVSMWLKGARG